MLKYLNNETNNYMFALNIVFVKIEGGVVLGRCFGGIDR